MQKKFSNESFMTGAQAQADAEERRDRIMHPEDYKDEKPKETSATGKIPTETESLAENFARLRREAGLA